MVLLLCKRCGDTHKNLINNKWKKVKNSQEEKRGASCESLMKKTPRSKVVNEISQGNKVLDLVLNIYLYR